MGVWAEGNFDNDDALDFVCKISDEATKEMALPDDIEELDIFMAAVAVRKILVEHCNAPRPKRAEVTALKRSALELYDEQIDELEPEPKHKTARRKVIAKTFDDFLALLKE